MVALMAGLVRWAGLMGWVMERLEVVWAAARMAGRMVMTETEAQTHR